MKLHLRLAIPLLVIAVVVTAAVTLGLIALVRGTVNVVLAQSGEQLSRITRHALLVRMENLDEVASVFAALKGNIAARDKQWKHIAIESGAVVAAGTGKVISAMGPAIDGSDLVGVTSQPDASDPRILRTETGLVIAGTARGDARDEVVVIGQLLGSGFADELRDLLQADIEIVVGGTAVASSRDPSSPRDEEYYPVATALATPGGAEVVVTMDMPAGAMYATRRKALGFTVGGGIILLLIAFLFYGYAIMRVTRPVNDLIQATERIAAGDLSAELRADAPAELGTLVREFNRMARSLKETQERLVHSAQLSSVGQLVAGISHELNNPLLGLLGHAEHLASKTKDADPAKEKLEIIIKEAQRMKRTLADLKSFTRPSVRERVRLDLHQLATEVLALVRHDATKSRVECRPVRGAEKAFVKGVPDRLRQVLLNLVLNALQSMEAGGGSIEIAITKGGAAGSARWVVAVEDTGPGIPAELKGRVREPFFSTKPGRMGLGLSISNEIVAEHGGELGIGDREDGGATVFFSLPAEEG